MNILFLTMVKMVDINESDIYKDLMRRFRKDGHEVYIVCPCERREGKPTSYVEKDGFHILSVKTLNVQKTNVIEKGIGQVLLEYQFMSAIKRHMAGAKFDVVLYSTPPITFNKVINWAKKENPLTMTYLMLKDIFPQNAVDLGMMSKSGLKGFLYRSFRKKEKEMYRISDHIGCMSPANVKYVLKENTEIDSSKVELCPNSYEVPEPDTRDISTIENERRTIRERYNLPVDKPIFIYGGNLGKPQGIPFLIECLEANRNRTDCHFLIVGDGFEYPRLEKWYNEKHPAAVTIIRRLPKADYDKLADVCDVGMIFLDHRFTIPNYPSRLLPYLIAKKPIIACTDKNCDTGDLAVKYGYGLYSESENVDAFTFIVDDMLKSDRKTMGERGYQFFLNNYTVDHTYNAIMRHVKH